MERLTERNPLWIDDELWERACEPDCEEIDAVYRKLKDYEDAEEQGLPLRWIPCSEQIPEEPEENPLFDGKCLEIYLVTTKYGSSEQDKVYPFRAFWNGINFTDGMNILDVIAWMPLPEPYKEREDKDAEV
jgi:hypothetical protein